MDEQPRADGARGPDPAAWWSSPDSGRGADASSGYGVPSPDDAHPDYAPPTGPPAFSSSNSSIAEYGAVPAGSWAADHAGDPFATSSPPAAAGTGWPVTGDLDRGYGTYRPYGSPDPVAPVTSPSPRRRPALVVVGALLAAGLVGGLAGGALVAARDGGGLTDPTATLGTGAPSATTVERAPDSVAGIASRVLRSTVSITVRTATSGGSGSGVVLRSDGYVLTNNHVVADAAAGGTITVTVNGSEGRALPARIVGRDPETDLAVLKIDSGGPFVPATLGRSADLVVGDPVVAIGSPLGLNGTVTTGIISALNRTVNVPAEGGGRATPLLNAVQTDAAINPGNSGGALVDIQGAVIGINSAIATLGASGSGDQSGSIGVGFAIPVDEARSVAEEIIRTGKATHPAIGVEAGNQVADDGTKQGARVSRVVGGGPADAAGLQVGDVIARVGDTRVGSVDELILALRQSRVGDRVTLTYQRDGASRTASVVLADKSD